jgi:hypothetical protein
MKVLVTHDQYGNISSIGVPSSKSGFQTSLKPQSGHQITEIEVPDLTDERDYEHLHTIRVNFRIETSGEQSKLVRKKP